MKDSSNVRRAFKIRDILLQKTDDQVGLTISELIQQLKREFGEDYQVSRNTVKSTIDELRESGFNVEEKTGSNRTAYYTHQYRLFEIHELRMLIDAVTSARFLTMRGSKQLINKLRKLTSDNLSGRLKNQISVENRVKAQNREIRYHIDKIHTAIQEKKKVSFQYGNYNVYKQFVLRKEGKPYVVIPLALVWNHDYYYLIANSEDSTIKHFRVDRMKNAEIVEEAFSKPVFDLSEHMDKTLNMYPGEVEHVEIHFDNQLVNVVIDRFGLDVPIRIVNEDIFAIKIKAAISEGFVRWLLTWGSDAKVVSPKHLADKIKDEAAKMVRIYADGIR